MPTVHTERLLPVRLFAHMRALANADSVTVSLPDQSSDQGILAAVAAAHPALAANCRACRVAVDDRFIRGAVALSADSRIDLIPPVSGG